MASDVGSGGHPPEKEEGAAAAGVRFDDLEDPRFQCCVCLEILYKPVVIACGHMSCFWCVHKAMHIVRESHCAICRQPYNHFPSICQLLHHFLLKLEPVEYKKREKEVLEYEKSKDTYSPQIIEFLNCKENNHVNGKDGGDKLEDGKTEAPEEVSLDGNIISKHSMKIKSEDVSCSLCKELLYQPAVLNCGHVYCMSCLRSLDDEALKCQVCGSVHPGDFPNVCLDLDHFLEEYFPAEYESRRKKLQFGNVQCNLEGSSSRSVVVGVDQENLQEEATEGFHNAGTLCTKEGMNRQFRRETCTQLDEDLSNVHIGVGCDSCGVYPIRGKRYRCVECTELIGFDLCEACYNTKSKLPGRFNQQHTSDHRMELDDTTLLRRLMRFRGIPGEGPEELVIEEAFVAPGAMVQIIGDDHEMEDDGEEDQLL